LAIGAKGHRPIEIARNADKIVTELPQSVYAPDAVGFKIERLLNGVEKAFLTPEKRFALAAQMIEELEANYPKWHGFAYLYARAVAQADAKGQRVHAEAWTSKLRSRYRGHPALLWLANRRAEVVEGPSER
jgi:hypothetical protein